MNKRVIPGARIKQLVLSAIMLVMPMVVFGQYYSVGESLSQQSRDLPVNFCANGTGSQTLGSLLTPEAGEPTRVLWINLFASW